MFVCGVILSKRLLGILPDNLIFLWLILISLIDSSLLDSLSLSGGGGSDHGESGVGEEAGVGGVGDGGGCHVAGDVLDGAGDQVVQAVFGLLKLDLLGVGGGGSVNRLEGSGLVGQGLLDCGGDGVGDGVAVAEPVGVHQLGGGLGGGDKSGQNNQELHDVEILHKLS